jgi:hypothetical protein
MVGGNRTDLAVSCSLAPHRSLRAAPSPPRAPRVGSGRVAARSMDASISRTRGADARQSAYKALCLASAHNVGFARCSRCAPADYVNYG